MKHIKEFFDFLKSGKSWKDKFNSIWNQFNKIKDKDNVDILSRPNTTIREDDFSIYLGEVHLCFYKKYRKKEGYVVIDFEECDYSDPKSDKGFIV